MSVFVFCLHIHDSWTETIFGSIIPWAIFHMTLFGAWIFFLSPLSWSLQLRLGSDFSQAIAYDFQHNAEYTPNDSEIFLFPRDMNNWKLCSHLKYEQTTKKEKIRRWHKPTRIKVSKLCCLVSSVILTLLQSLSTAKKVGNTT